MSKELLRTYAIIDSMHFMLKQHDAVDIIGSTKQLHYAIRKKVAFFGKQIDELDLGKIEKISKKCALFMQASYLSKEARTNLKDNTFLKKSENIGISGVIRMMYFKEHDSICKVINGINDIKINTLQLQDRESAYAGGKFGNMIIYEINNLLDEHYQRFNESLG